MSVFKQDLACFAGYPFSSGSNPMPVDVQTSFWAFTPAGNPDFPDAPLAQKLADF